MASRQRYQQDTGIDRYSSIAKYSVAILSALIVFFPSSNTFIKPPHTLDYLLPIALIIGGIAFIANSYVLLLRDTGKGKVFSDAMLAANLWGLVLTILVLIVIFTYIVTNVWIDRSSKPNIDSIKVNPLSIKVGSLVEFNGEATDQDSDNLKWVWEVKKRDENSNQAIFSSKLKSNLRTAYWTPISPGSYSISAKVSDDSRESEKQKIEFTVN